MTGIMNRQDLRKLVTTFLVLAVLAASASLAVTSLARQRSEGPAAIARKADAERQAIPRIGDQALIESVPGTVIEGYDLAKEFSPSVEPQDNFTDNLAKGLAYEMVTANPTGPEPGFGIAPPSDLNAVMDSFVTDAALAPTTYAIDESKVKVAATYTTAQVDEYFATLEAVFAAASSTRGISGLIAHAEAAGDPNEAVVQASNFIIADAQETLYNTVAPAPAEELHRSLLAYLELNRKLTDLDYTTDPLKAVIFAAKFPEFQAKEESRVRAALAVIEKDGDQLFSDAREPFVIASLLGIPTARAIIFHDIGHTIVSALNGMGIYGSWSQMIIEYVKRVATQVLKNQIVGRMIQQTIKWVQGGGKPQFITNWKKFLTDAAEDAAGIVLTQLAPQLCSNFRAFTTNVVRATTEELRREDPITCTLDQVVKNVRDFYQDFISGGWLGLFTLLEPQNNVWGATILAHEAVNSQINRNVEAAEGEASANDGYKGMQRCVNYDIQTVGRSELPRLQQTDSFVGLGPRGCYTNNAPSTGPDPAEYAACFSDPTLPGCDEILAGPPPSSGGAGEYCDVKICRADGKQTTTPGGAVAASVEKALGASVDNIVNAEDLAGLIGVLVDSAINRLVGLAERGILGLFGANDDGGRSTGVEDDVASGGGAGSESESDLESVRAPAQQLVGGYIERIDQASTTAARWQPLASSTQPVLVSVGMTCPGLAADADQRVQAIDRLAPVNEDDRAEIDETAAALDAALAGIENATSSVAVSSIVSDLNPLNASIGELSARVSTRTGQLESLAADAAANLEDRACDTPLTALDE